MGDGLKLAIPDVPLLQSHRTRVSDRVTAGLRRATAIFPLLPLNSFVDVDGPPVSPEKGAFCSLNHERALLLSGGFSYVPNPPLSRLEVDPDSLTS